MVIQVSEALFIAHVVQVHGVMSLKDCKAEALAMEDIFTALGTSDSYKKRIVKWVAP